MGQARGWNWDLLTCIYFLLTGAATAATSPPIYLVFTLIFCIYVSDVSNGSAAKAKKMDVKAMSAKQYMDEMVVPTLLKALSVVNQKVRRLLLLLFFKISNSSARKAEY